MTRFCVSVTTVALLLAVAETASAQQLLLGGAVGVGSGIEGGDPGWGSTEFRRARTRIVGGLDARIDEDQHEGIAVSLFADLEPHTSIGGDVRYVRWLGEVTEAFVGVTGAFAPHTLFGGELGLRFHVPLGSPSLSFYLEPAFAALPLGTDLPTDRPLIWGLFSCGIHANL